MIGKQQHSIDCPVCGAKVSFSLEDLAKKRNKACPKGHQSNVTDKSAREAKKVLDSIKKLGGR